VLTGCPLSPLDFTGGTSTSSGTGTSTATLTGCGGTPEKDCDDGNPCTLDTCEDGECVYEAAPSGTACPDANTCNGAETCDGNGVCGAGTPLVVDDGDNCTLDLCDPKTGEETHPLSPACEPWEPTAAAGAPTPRTNHTAVWTGSQMIVWGGEVAVAEDPAGVTATGARYDPASKTWTPMSTVNAPPPRHSHSAVWTGSKMIVWGGYGAVEHEITGGVYDPASDLWTPVTTVNAPSGRVQHRSVWIGSEMLVWGGLKGSALSTGARYAPAADTWTALPQGLSPRFDHSVIWAETRMIVWGGNDLFDWHQDGAFFDPATGWAEATSLTNVPERRQGHVTLWTGTQMIVWGGFDGGDSLDTGGVFDPAPANGGAWTEITTTGAPQGREKLVGLWTGAQLMVWGGCGGNSCFTTFGDGGFWTPGPNGGTWTPVPEGKITTPRINATAVWTGTQAIVWGGKAGFTGKLFDTGAQSVAP